MFTVSTSGTFLMQIHAASSVDPLVDLLVSKYFKYTDVRYVYDPKTMRVYIASVCRLAV